MGRIMAKQQQNVKIDYKQLANVVRQQTRQGYRLESAYCNPRNLKEIVCTFLRVSINPASNELRVNKEPKKKRTGQKKV